MTTVDYKRVFKKISNNDHSYFYDYYYCYYYHYYCYCYYYYCYCCYYSSNNNKQYFLAYTYPFVDILMDALIRFHHTIRGLGWEMMGVSWPLTSLQH